MNTRIPLLLVVLSVAGCGGGGKTPQTGDDVPEPETDFFVFDLEAGLARGPRFTTLNELVDTVCYIPLETHPDALIPARYRFAAIGGDMFIGGGLRPLEAPIRQFDSLGRFVRQIIRSGRGPNEIPAGVMGWYVHPALKQINVVSFGGFMVVADIDDGKLTSVPFDERQSFNRVPLGDSTFVSTKNLWSWSKGTTKDYMYFIDRTGTPVHLRERDDELADYSYSIPEGAWAGPWEDYRLWPDCRGGAVFMDIFNDTLYRVRSRREITPLFVFRRGGLMPRPGDVKNRDARQRQVYFESVMETGDHVFVNYHHEGRLKRSVWSKADGGLLLNGVENTRGLFSDTDLPFALPSGDVINLNVAYADREHVYCVMEAMDACKFLPGVKEDDNPVVVVAKPKK